MALNEIGYPATPGLQVAAKRVIDANKLSALLFSRSCAAREFTTTLELIVRNAMPILEYVETLDLSPDSVEWQARATLRASVELFAKSSGGRNDRT